MGPREGTIICINVDVLILKLGIKITIQPKIANYGMKLCKLDKSIMLSITDNENSEIMQSFDK